MTTTRPPVLSRDIGEAERTLRSVIQSRLDAAGVSFAEWTTLVTLDVAGPLTQGEIVERQVTGRIASAEEAVAAIDHLVSSGLIAPDRGNDGDPLFGRTTVGEAVYRPLRQAVDRITAGIYGDLSPEDVEATHRTLVAVAERAREVPPPPTVPLSRDIGLAERTLRAILDRLVADGGITFSEWTTFILLDTVGQLSVEDIVQRQVAGLVAPEAEVRAQIDGLLTSGRIAPIDGASGGALAITDAGRAVFEPVRQGIARATEEVFGDLPAGDLEVTRRTLTEAARRGAAVLASLDAG